MKKRTKTISAVLSGAVIVIILGVVGFFLWQNTQKTAENVTDTPQEIAKESAAPTVTPEQIINDIRDTLAQTYELKETDVDNQIADGQLGIRIESDYDKYLRLFGEDFTIPEALKSSRNLDVSEKLEADYSYNSPALKEVRETFQTVLSGKYQLQHTNTQTREESASATLTYEDDIISCSVPSVDSKHTGSTISCFNKADTAKALANIDTFYAILPEEYRDNVQLTPVGIKASPTAGYKIGKANANFINSGGGMQTLFYQTPDEAWYFFTYTQEGVACETINATENTRKAFEGYPCY